MSLLGLVKLVQLCEELGSGGTVFFCGSLAYIRPKLLGLFSKLEPVSVSL